MTSLFLVIGNSISLWWLIACLGLGLLYSLLFYFRQKHSSVLISYLLGFFRTACVAVIMLLILSPLVKKVVEHSQKPLILVAQDNSSSISLFKPKNFDLQKFVSRLAELKKNLGNDYDVREFHFDKQLKDSLSYKFDGKQTDISAALQGLGDRFVNQNVGALVLATDGIYNTGSSPQNMVHSLKAAIYSIALGDTVPKRDILIGSLDYNKTAFLGNDFEVQLLVESYQSKGEQIQLNVAEDGTPVTSQVVGVLSDNFHKVISLRLHADKKGVHKFSFNLRPLTNEISKDNNSETAFVEVLDNKQKILLLYNGPHPDISTIKGLIEKNRNFEVMPVMVSDFDISKTGLYSLVILYQIPASGNGMPQTLHDQLVKSKTPLWYIIGAQSDIQQFNSSQNILQVTGGRQDMQEVFAAAKADFTTFTLSDSAKQTLGILPPLVAPFGNYTTPSSQNVLLKQKIGHVETSYPLLVFGEDEGARIAVLSAEGIWKWRLAEFAARGNNNGLEELVSQSVQYLTTKGNHSRFKVYPAKNIFSESDEVLLSGELYNEALELVNTPDVKIELKGRTGNTFNYLLTRNGKGYQLNAGLLPPDDYAYKAAAKLGNNTFSASGQFAVRSIDIETRQSAADHQILYTLANESRGQVVMPDQINSLADLIRKNEDIKTIVYADETYYDLINQKWLFALILLLLSAEWFLRKREGEI